MIVREETWGDIPLLHVFNDQTNDVSPIVIFLHGFMSAKEHNLHYAYQLVKQGIRVIMPDALLHGSRTKHLSEEKMSLNFWGIVVQTIQEVHKLYIELQNRNLLKSNKIALAGTSMGAIAACGCLKKYDWISAASIIMGAPGYNDLIDYQLQKFDLGGTKLPMSDAEKENIHKLLSEYDITKQPKAFRNRPVLFWHGQKDPVVPFENAHQFYLQLRSYYEKTPDRLKFIADPKAGHKVPRKGVLQITNWLAQQLEY